MNLLACNIIDAFGGTSATAAKAHSPVSTVHSWRKNGIPASRLAHLNLIAAAEGISIDWETGERLGHGGVTTTPVAPPSSNKVCQIIGQVPA